MPHLLKKIVLSDSVWTNFSPGTQFVNDKIFGLFVDKMIRRLLGETPLLRRISAKPVAQWTRRSGWQLNRDLLTVLTRDKDRYVVKQVDDDGGSGVWIGMNDSKSSLVKLLELLRADPQKAKVSLFALSTYDTDYILVKEADLGNSNAALRSAGHEVLGEWDPQ